jgi:hypothetical protein
MTPWPLAALAASLVASPAWAVVCLSPGSMGPDVPGCTPAADAKEQATAVGQNLLALAGQAAAEQFSEREAIDAAGPLIPRTTAAGRSKDSPRLRSSSQEGLPSPVSTLLAPLKDARDAEYEELASAMVRGTGSSFSELEAGSRKPTAAIAPLQTSRSLSSSGPPSPGSSQPLQQQQGRKPDLGPAVSDEDVGSPGSPTATPASPRSPTARQCTISNPCPSKVD